MFMFLILYKKYFFCTCKFVKFVLMVVDKAILLIKIPQSILVKFYGNSHAPARPHPGHICHD